MKFFCNVGKVYKYSYGCRRYIFMYLLCSFLIMLIGLLLPIIISIQLVGLAEGFWEKVILYSLFAFGISLLRDILNCISLSFSRKFSKLVVSKIQLDLGREILKIELSDIDRHSNGLFIQRLTRDASEISDIFTFGISIVSSVIEDVGVFIIVFFINSWIGLFYLIYAIISMIIQKVKLKKLDKVDKELRDKREQTSGFTTELIRGIRDIKMLNAENSFMKKVEDNIIELNNKTYDIDSLRNWFNFISASLRALFELGLVILIVYFVRIGSFEIAIGLVIYNYRNYIIWFVQHLSSVLDYVRNFNMSCERVFSLFASQDFKKEKFGCEHLDRVNGNFEFNNVYFSYGSNEVLNGISFKVHANETVAFVGKSGSGKTTIFNLMCKFYDTSKGSIKIDGVDIRKLDKDTIRGNITIISQNPYIFNMSIRDNLKLVSEELTEEEMKKACEMACLDDFINTLPERYDTVLGEGGVNLSGGQKQRLAIARALVQKTEIILFDEATSALDNETQAKIQKSIDNLKNDYTILIIAHRLSTIMNCDRILFIEDGKVVCEGNHQYLIKNCKSYKQLYESENIEKNNDLKLE